MEIGFLSRSFELRKHHNKDTKQFVSLLSAREAPPPQKDQANPSDFSKTKGNFDTVPLFRKQCVLM
jgi:hypothetical protein